MYLCIYVIWDGDFFFSLVTLAPPGAHIQWGTGKVEEDIIQIHNNVF